MRYYFAPLESITTALYRQLHQQYFGGVARYYMPFVSPTQQHLFTARHLRDLAPEYNAGVPAVPQVLTKQADDFIWCVKALVEMGYSEVNLNLGCPSSTVTAKGKGSGFLSKPKELDEFLEKSYAEFVKMPVNVSVKTRLGRVEEGEFEEILKIYNQYPISELTIHPRVQKDYYKNDVRMGAFEAVLQRTNLPVCYNGDLVTLGEVKQFEAAFPNVQALMIGRGAMADPAIFRKINGGAPATREEIQAFANDLFDGYVAQYGAEHNAFLRMREIWFYMVHLFADNEEFVQKFRRMKTPTEYKILANRLFRELPLKEDAGHGFSW